MTKAASPPLSDDFPDTGMPDDALKRAKGTGGGEVDLEGGDEMMGHLLMQEGMMWQQLGLPYAKQPWLLPLPWQQPPLGGGNLLLEQEQLQARVQSNQAKQEQGVKLDLELLLHFPVRYCGSQRSITSSLLGLLKNLQHFTFHFLLRIGTKVELKRARPFSFLVVNS